jgi:AcrR family transcriptional regulator
MSSWSDAPRPKRRPSETTRHEVLARAISLVEHTGLGVSLDHLNMEALIRDVGAPRTTVYRLWPSKEDFLADVLVELITPGQRGFTSYDAPSLSRTQARLAQRVSDHPDEPVGPAVREAVRIGVAESFDSMLAHRGWQTYVAATLALDSLPADRRERVEIALREMQATFLDAMSSYYQSILELTGLGLRPGLSTRQLSVVASTVLEGLVQRRRLTPELVDAPTILDAGDDGGLPWHLAAVAVMGVVDQFLEEGWSRRTPRELTASSAHAVS